MEDFIKIIASVIGLIIYWSLSNKNKKKTKPAQGPTQINPPTAPRKKPVVIQEDFDEGPKYEPVTFEELLEQFGQTKKKPTISRAEREAISGIDDEFIPATDTKEEAQAELKQYYEELHDTNLTITESDLVDHRAAGFELNKRKTNYYARLLQDPQRIKEAFIMKEIFDRKHF